MTKKILCVDDEPNVLQAFERQLRKQFEIQTALGPEEGLRMISESGPFAVVVSDLRMPGMNGVDFLTRVRKMTPETVRVMLTGEADLTAAMMAVNEGNIFQFLTKPCPSDMLAHTLDAALEQYRLITAERDLLERTVQGCIGMLVETLSLVNPTAFSRTHRIRRYVRDLAKQLKLENAWQYELAATLSQIGCVVVPPEVMEKCHLKLPLTQKEQEIVAAHSRVGHQLLAKIPRLESVAQMVAMQGSGWPGGESSDAVLIGANLLRVALDFDELSQHGKSLEAIQYMRQRREYNPQFIEALRQLHMEGAASQIRLVTLEELKPSMIMESDLFSKTGLLLLTKGQEVTESAIARLHSFAAFFGIAEPISVTFSGDSGKSEGGGHLTDLTHTLSKATSRLVPGRPA